MRVGSVPLFFCVVVVTVCILVCGTYSVTAAQQIPEIDFDTVSPLPHEWRNAVTQALTHDVHLLPSDHEMVVTSYELEGDWIHVVLTPRYIIDARWEIEFTWDEIVEVLGTYNDTGEYVAYLLNSEDAIALKELVPGSFMAVDLPVQAQSVTTAPTPLFPWTNGQVWRRTNGWHNGYWGLPNNAVDIAPNRGSSNPSRDYAVLASTSGRVTRICSDGADQAVLKLETELGVFGHLHMRNSSIPSGILNQDVVRGRYLGYLYDTGGGYNSYCGYGTGVHLHYVMPNRDISVNGYSANSIASGGAFESSNHRVDSNAGADTDGGTIGYGETESGTIDPSRDYDDFYFDASAGDIVEIREEKDGGSLDTYLRLYDANGRQIAHNDDYGGSRNSFLRRTLRTSGRYRIRAGAYGNSTGNYKLRLTKVGSDGGGSCSQDCRGENRWIAFGQTLTESINPANDRDTYYFSGTAGRVVSIRMNRTGSDLDSYVELWSPSNVRLASNDDGGGSLNSWLVYTLPSNGTYRISAYSYSNSSTGNYEIKLESISGNGSGNLARGKQVATSSVEYSGVEGWKATDGRTDTRWSSRFSDPQWIWVDLGRNQNFNQVVLKWETAHGRSFGISYWTGSEWRNVYWTDSGRGGTNTINFGRVNAQYVLMFGTARGTQWGYSLWEFEVYDTTTTVLPTVPPDDPDKAENSASLTAPLPPTEGDKDVVLSGDGEYGQEETPLAEPEEASEVTIDLGATQTVVSLILEPSEFGRHGALESDEVQFSGEGSSQVEEDEKPIIAYLWRSDRQGEIGTEAAFTLPTTSLLPGRHTIYFKAQNELGTWSDEASVVLDVVWPHQTYLPILSAQ